jgi:hypothetical protein
MMANSACAVDQRVQFVIAAEKHEEPFATVCRRFSER